MGLGLIVGGSYLCKNSELFGPLFCIWILNFFKFLHYSLDFNALCVIQDYVFQTFEIYAN